jgi:hypothetical protein
LDQVFLPLLIATSSLAAVVIGIRGFGLSRAGLRVGTQRALELIGASVAFFLLNLAVALPIILAVWTLTSGFVSVYVLNDRMLVVLSAVQGIVFCCRRRS